MHPVQWQRHSKRLQQYDYSQEGLYFVTINCKQRKPLFGAVKDGVMFLNEFGKIAQENWLKTPQIRPNISLGAFVIMPDHLHGIISIDSYKENGNKIHLGQFRSPTQTLGAIVRGYKGTVTRQIKDYVREVFNRDSILANNENIDSPIELIPQLGSIWQVNYHEHIIRNHEEHLRIGKYILENPLKISTNGCKM